MTPSKYYKDLERSEKIRNVPLEGEQIMGQYKTCPDCGANLDYDECCDCKQHHSVKIKFSYRNAEELAIIENMLRHVPDGWMRTCKYAPGQSFKRLYILLEKA